MAKFYSLLLLFVAFLSIPSIAQNVGVGTNSPQEKLDVNGAIKIGNTTNDFIGTIRYNAPYFEGRNDTGWINLGGGGSDNDWVIDGDNMYSGVDGYVGIGIATPGAKLHVVTDSMISIVGISFNPDFGVGIVGIGNGKSPMSFPPEGAGGTFIGHYGVFASSDDSSGIGIYAENLSGGYAGSFLGDLNLNGALRNTDDNLYGGSIAVNDGMTVGDIAGASCAPSIPAIATFDDTIGGFLFFSGTSQTYSNTNSNGKLVNDTLGDCRKITGVYYEVTFYDFETFPIRVNVYLRNSYLGTIDIADAQVYNNSSYPTSGNPTFVSQDTADGGYYSNWSFTSNNWNGTLPDTADWYVHAVNFGFDTDYWQSYRGTINYKYGFTTAAPIYANYGEIRASGPIYANSTDLLGDVAEFMKVDPSVKKPEPGDIVSISAVDPQTFVITEKAYDPLVAGVISENPSVFLNDPTAGEPIALTGRVKVKVNLEGGKIKLGDPITSSNVPGVGMKAGKNSVILGQALESFDGSRTKEGKIWILLAKGHYERLDPGVKTIIGNNEDLGGVQINGAKRVGGDVSEVTIKWSEKLNMEIPDDIEFEDLVVDLTPFGGSADISVKDVNKEGFTVAVASRSENFKGFYYKVDLVSPKFDFGTDENPGVAEGNDSSPEFKDKMAIAEHFEQVTGKSLRSMPAMNNWKKIKEYKTGVMESWKNADPKLYNKLMSN